MSAIAMDGPAGAGKSTVAKRVAESLGYTYVDTGAMYRALALAAIQREVGDAAGLAELARTVELRAEGKSVLLDGVDVTERIRSPDVTERVSSVAAEPDVRSALGGAPAGRRSQPGRGDGRPGYRVGRTSRRRREGVPDRFTGGARPAPRVRDGRASGSGDAVDRNSRPSRLTQRGVSAGSMRGRGRDRHDRSFDRRDRCLDRRAGAFR